MKTLKCTSDFSDIFSIAHGISCFGHMRSQKWPQILENREKARAWWGHMLLELINAEFTTLDLFLPTAPVLWGFWCQVQNTDQDPKPEIFLPHRKATRIN